jgi:hypothetical protein
MVYAVPLIIFMDNVSGNISKQWNKHFVIYMSNANLQCEMLDHEFFVQFVTSSPHASPMELMDAMKQSISYILLTARYLCDSLVRSGLHLHQGSLHGTAETKKKSSWFHTDYSWVGTILCRLKNAVKAALAVTVEHAMSGA